MTLIGVSSDSATPRASDPATLRPMLRRYIADPAVGWSCGSFGAIAEFTRDVGESVAMTEDARLVAVTARGGIEINPVSRIRAIGYAARSCHGGRPHAEIALCLPERDCAMARRRVVTELGPDENALRDDDKDAILFDLGLGQLQVDVCVRAGDAETVRLLRNADGRNLFAEHGLVDDLVHLSPHRVFLCRLGRVEIFQRIGVSGGTSPEGPHTHIMPKLLARGLTHASNLPIPIGFVPCMTVYPPSEDTTKSGWLVASDLEAD